MKNLSWIVVSVGLVLSCGSDSALHAQDLQLNTASSAAVTTRDDSFERKMQLLQEAWQRQDYDVARSLTHSLRDTLIQTQQEQGSLGTAVSDAAQSQLVGTLPAAWQTWAQGWQRFQIVKLGESVGETRRNEPVEVQLSFPIEQMRSGWRELRVAAVREGTLVQVPCQVLSEVRSGAQRDCRLLWLADCEARASATYLVFFNNPNAELPEYPSDLVTEGEGYGLDISNAHFKAALSRQTGQLERLTLRREHGLELFSGGEGHGEPPGIDWAHDYVDEGGFQKLRISLWDACPDYHVVRGPLCTIVRRWGFPVSPVHPLFTPARLHIDVEYRFYTGLPWFEKRSTMKAVQAFHAEALRDDEWLFSGLSFTDQLWIDRDGRVHTGAVSVGHEEQLWGVGFYNRQTHDSIAALFIEHSAEGLPELKHTGVPLPHYRWHGQLWSRYPLPVKHVPKDAVLRQKNAYVVIPFTEESGPGELERIRRCQLHPLVVRRDDAAAVDFHASLDEDGAAVAGSALARPGERGDSEVSKAVIWQALRDCKDAQLYTADINVVDLGLVYDVRVRGDVVTLVMAMPHRGRPRLGYFVDGSISVHPTKSMPIRARLMEIPGVRQVTFEQTWQPAWSSQLISDEGRLKLGLP